MMAGNLTQHVKKILVVGGGVGGCAAAIRFAERGVAVDLIDLEENWGAAGTGVTLSSLTARALCDLGLSEQLAKYGHLHDDLTLCDSNGNVLSVIPTPRIFSPDVPAQGGILRPELHKIMVNRMKELDVSVRTGTSLESFKNAVDNVDVVFSDGTNGTYDLVIGADGLFSKLRDDVFPDAPVPHYTGQVCWRVPCKLPAGWNGSRMFFGPIKVGFTPYGQNEMYMYTLENASEKPWYEPEDLLPRLRALLEPFGGELAELRDAMNEDTEILARPLETVLLDGPWHSGRIVMIGDAVHATTPHLASGAGMAVEDAIVLVDELDAAESVELAFAAFMERRLPRGKLVVGNSLRLGEMEINHASQQDMSNLMLESLKAIAQPY